jgi:hypothetical protein
LVYTHSHGNRYAVTRTTDEPFKCVFCLRSAPGHTRTRNSFAKGESYSRRLGSRDPEFESLEASLRFRQQDIPHIDSQTDVVKKEFNV